MQTESTNDALERVSEMRSDVTNAPGGSRNSKTTIQERLTGVWEGGGSRPEQRTSTRFIIPR
jgi:hypothetical protein